MENLAPKADLPANLNVTGQPHEVVVVGGGAGGLELVTCLGDRLGRRGRDVGPSDYFVAAGRNCQTNCRSVPADLWNAVRG